MKALIKKEATKGIWLADVAKPQIGMTDVLIKIKKTAICGTDVHIYQWDAWSQKNVPLGLTTGHEFMGEIVELGAAVTGLKIGQRVSGEGHVVCGVCRNCRAGKRHLCISTRGVGVNLPGAFAEYLALPASNVFILPDDIADDVASIFDPFGNATHTALSFDLIGEDVLITGAGPIGIMAGMIAKQAGARKIVITDVNEYRLQLAQRVGIEHCVNIAKEKLADCVSRIGLKEGFDIGLEMSGNIHAFSDMLANVRMGAKIALLGILPSGAGIDWDKVIFKGLTLKGIYGREMFETWYKMGAMLQAGLPLKNIITHQFDIANFNEGFEVMASGNSGKVILNWE